MTVTEKYINPFTDFGFKKIFGTEPNKALLIDFLNQVILPEGKKIIDLTYKKNDQLGTTEFDRKAIFDLYCTSSEGEHFIVEMQKAKQNYFKDRTVFYASFPIQEQAQKGDWDYKLSDIFTVGILDFTFADVEEKEVRHEVKLKDQKCRVFYDKLTFVYLEMPHFTKKEDELETLYDKWLYLIKNLSKLQDRPSIFQEKIFLDLFEIAEIAKFDSHERQEYEESLKYYRDLKNVIDTAFEDGKIEGEIEGEIKGEIKAKTKGIINALKQGKLSVEEISEIFNTTIDFVLKIKDDHSI